MAGSDNRLHRQRLRERFLRGGTQALADYELLELLLFSAQLRRDQKPLAKRLLLRNLSTTLRHRRFLFSDSFLLLWKWRVG